MEKLYFASDYMETAAPEIIERLAALSGKKFTGYALGFPQLESYYTDSSLSEKWQHYVARPRFIKLVTQSDAT